MKTLFVKNTRSFFMLTATAFTLLFLGCDKPEDVPSYIYIKTFELSTDDATQGANTQKVTEAWVYANNQILGAYTLPAEIPIPYTGATELNIYAGIRNNGSSASPAIYFHYNPYKITKTLTAGKTDTIVPQTTYKKDLKFAWLENFEASNTLDINTDSDSVYNFKITTTDVKYGKQCGLFTVTDKNPLMAVTTSTSFKGIPSDQQVYLEIDYKGSADMFIQLIGNSVSGTKVLEYTAFRPQADWNKAYINFRFKDYGATEYPSFNFIISAQIPKDADGKATTSNADLRIDNIKLVYP